MDALHSVGHIITEPQGRDAIHIAVVPVVAGERLAPGDHILIVGESTAYRVSDYGPGAAPPIGVVDPFLKTTPHTGDRFWLFLYPGSITSLRHEWTHPAFEVEASPSPPPPPDHPSKVWLRAFADRFGLTYDRLMKEASNHLADDSYFIDGGSEWEGFSTPDEFWIHYSAVTGEEVVDGGNFFSCSC